MTELTTLTAAEIEEAGITPGHVKAWILQHPTLTQSLARALTDGEPFASTVATHLNEVSEGMGFASPPELLQVLRQLPPISGAIEARPPDTMVLDAFHAQLDMLERK